MSHQSRVASAAEITCRNLKLWYRQNSNTTGHNYMNKESSGTQSKGVDILLQWVQCEKGGLQSMVCSFSANTELC